MTATGLVEPDDKGKDGGSKQPGDAAGVDNSSVDNGKRGARRRGSALRALLQSAGSGAVAGTARYAAERIWEEFLGK